MSSHLFSFLCLCVSDVTVVALLVRKGTYVFLQVIRIRIQLLKRCEPPLNQSHTVHSQEVAKPARMRR